MVDPLKTMVQAGYTAKPYTLDARRVADALRRDSVLASTIRRWRSASAAASVATLRHVLDVVRTEAARADAAVPQATAADPIAITLSRRRAPPERCRVRPAAPRGSAGR